MNPLIALMLDESRVSTASALAVGSCVYQWLCWQRCSQWPQLGLPGAQGLVITPEPAALEAGTVGQIQKKQVGFVPALFKPSPRCPCKLLFSAEGARNSAAKLEMLFHLQV